jgi:hypothetical protein
MKKYRYNTVLLPKIIPVLIPSGSTGAREGVSTFLGRFERLAAKDVRVLDDAALNLFVEDGPAFQREFGGISEAQSSKFLGMLQLATAFQSSDPLAASEPRKRLATGHRLQGLLDIEMSDPPVFLAKLSSKGAEAARLMLWYTPNGDLLPALFCRDVLTALYVLAIIQVAGGRGIGACLVCKRPLLRNRGTRKFCSDPCRQELFRRNHSTKATRGRPPRRDKRSDRK